jgi:hypothetical protein
MVLSGKPRIAVRNMVDLRGHRNALLLEGWEQREELEISRFCRDREGPLTSFLIHSDDTVLM